MKLVLELIRRAVAEGAESIRVVRRGWTCTVSWNDTTRQVRLSLLSTPLAALERHCRFCPARVLYNGNPVDPPGFGDYHYPDLSGGDHHLVAQVPEGWPSHASTVVRGTGFLALHQDLDRRARTCRLDRGVTDDEVVEDIGCPGLIAAVADPRRDVLRDRHAHLVHELRRRGGWYLRRFGPGLLDRLGIAEQEWELEVVDYVALELPHGLVSRAAEIAEEQGFQVLAAGSGRLLALLRGGEHRLDPALVRSRLPWQLREELGPVARGRHGRQEIPAGAELSAALLWPPNQA